MRGPYTERTMKKFTPFKKFLKAQKMSVPDFAEEAVKRGVITAKPNSLYKASRFNPKTKTPIIPRNREYYEAAFPGLKF